MKNRYVTTNLLLLMLLFLSTGYSLLSQQSSSHFIKKYNPLLTVSAPSNPKSARSIHQHLSTADIYFKKEKNQNQYQQYYKGLPIEDALHRVQRDASGGVILAGDIYDLRGVDVDVSPTITAESAATMAIAYSRQDLIDVQLSLTTDYEGLSLYVDGEQLRLVHHCRVISEHYAVHESVYVDAHSGELVAIHTHVHTHEVPAASLYNDTVMVDLDHRDDRYYFSSDAGMVYDLRSTRQYDAAEMVSSADDSLMSAQVAVQAQYGIESTRAYFSHMHDRASYDDRGSRVTAYINYGESYNNAFWNGFNLVFGSGDQYNYGAIVSLDIVGHEYTHGVVDYAAKFRYTGESGALDESFADIFGEMVEYETMGANDWILGKDVGLHHRLLFRSMSDPNRAGQPDTYGGRYWIEPQCAQPSRANDRCGVHTNSGVQNKWFYLLSIGETGINDHDQKYDVQGIGRRKAAQIAYRSLTEYLSPTSDYQVARSGSIQAAIDLYGRGSVEHEMTTTAWYAVGVGEPYVEDVSAAHIDTLELDTIEVDEVELVLTVDSVDIHSAVASWTDVDDSTMAYSLYLDDRMVYSGSGTSFMLSDLSASTEYECVVSGAISDSIVTSDTVVFMTLADTVVIPIDDDCVYFSFDFENGASGWLSSAGGMAIYKGRKGPNASQCLRVKGGRDGNHIISEALDVPLSSMVLSMQISTWSMELSDEFIIEYSTGDDWIELDRLSTKTTLVNGQPMDLAYTIIDLYSGTIQIRLTNMGNTGSDHVYIDNVQLSGPCLDSFFAPATTSDQTMVYPNPTSDQVQIRMPQDGRAVRLYDMMGRLLIEHESRNSGEISWSLTSYRNGAYIVELETSEGTTRRLLIKN